MTKSHIAGRSYFRAYSVSRKRDIHNLIQEAIAASGGQVLYASGHTQAPFFFGVQTDREERLGLLVYPSRFGKVQTRNRPADENRGQLRLGSESSWVEFDHPVAFDVAGVDTTLMLGVDTERKLFIGLDPRLWDPMPLGISYYAKDSDLEAMGDKGWNAWEKDNHSGSRRGDPRSESGLETVVAFRPARLLDFARFERKATDLGLDTPLRLNAAEGFAASRTGAEKETPTHILENQFAMSSREILEIIATRTRLQVAVRGGVAEHHLEKLLTADPLVSAVARRDRDGEPDFDVTLESGRAWVVECKNASPSRYASGEFKVEVQKTRASKGDPASRYYKVSEFEVVAACLFSATGSWEFRYALTASLPRHSEYPDRIAPMQRVSDTWKRSLQDLE